MANTLPMLQAIAMRQRTSESTTMMAVRGRALAADRLITAGRLSEDDVYRAASFARANNVRIEDALIDLGIMTEADLLREIATFHQTRFVSSEQLAKLVVAPRILEIMSAKVAEVSGAFPVLWVAATSTLTVVTADPGDLNALNDIRVATGARNVVAFAARPGAVRAAIARFYRGEGRAFRAILRPSGVFAAVDGR